MKKGHYKKSQRGYYYYYRKKRFRWRNVKRLQGHLTNAKDRDKNASATQSDIRVYVRCDRGLYLGLYFIYLWGIPHSAKFN